MDKYDIDENYILNSIREREDVNEDNYYDYLYELIDQYVIRYDYDMKELVDSYGVFKAIKLYSDNFGEYEINDNELKNYMMLGFLIVKDLFTDKYPNYTDVDNCKHVCDDCEKLELENALKAFAIHCN